MGYMRHHAIVVTHYNRKQIEKAHQCAEDLDLIVSNLSDECMNGYSSFCIFPDGSKEGWDVSDHCNDLREAFIDQIKDINLYGFIQWCEISFGDEHGPAKILKEPDYFED